MTGILPNSAALLTRATAAFLWLLASLTAAAQSVPAPGDYTALLNQHCLTCHNNDLKVAQLTLQGADLANVAGNRAFWEKVLRKVETRAMPPSGAPPLGNENRTKLVAYLTRQLDLAAAEEPDPGRTIIRRLNRAEYSNAIRDLLALDINPGESLPPDDSGYGFDNIGDVLSLSPVRVERYLSAARRVARLAVGNTDIKPEVAAFDALFDGSLIRASRNAPRAARYERVSEDLPFGSMGGLSINYPFPVDAEYVFKIKMSEPSGFTETAPPVGQILELRRTVKAGLRHVGLTFMRSDSVPEVLPTVGRRFGRTPDGTSYLDLRLGGERLELYEVPEALRGREINELSILGPYNITGPGDSASRRRIFSCMPESAAEEEPCAREILTSLGRRAFRRPPTEGDLEPLLAIYEQGRSGGNSFDRGIESALVALLVSPKFLFRIERDPAGSAPGSVYKVDDFELASRLSFFLWSSIPDEELLQVAEDSQLRNPKILQQQITRMLDDPKSNAFVSNFAGQWLLLRNLDQVTPDPAAFPQFDDSLREGFQRESELFFNAILRESRPITELLDADFTFVNERLAEFYKIPGVYGPRFRRVELADSTRGGLLGQGSVLTVTSYPTRTSVVLRGKWILENLLGAPPPPPPPNVPPLELQDSTRKLSVREAMEQHRANPSCAACHARMDPIGFALENFDGIGRWRETENDIGIDPTGSLPDGTEFHGPTGLKQLLLSQNRNEFVSTFAEKLMIYALGRGLEPQERPAVRAVIRKAENQGLTMRALIDSIVESPQFQMRRTPE